MVFWGGRGRRLTHAGHASRSACDVMASFWVIATEQPQCTRVWQHVGRANGPLIHEVPRHSSTHVTDRYTEFTDGPMVGEGSQDEAIINRARPYLHIRKQEAASSPYFKLGRA